MENTSDVKIKLFLDKYKGIITKLFMGILIFGVLLLAYDFVSSMVYNGKLKSAYEDTLQVTTYEQIQSNMEIFTDEDGYLTKTIEPTDAKKLSYLPLGSQTIPTSNIMGGLYIKDLSILMPTYIGVTDKNVLNTGAVFVGDNGQAKVERDLVEGNLVFASNSSSKKGVLFSNLRNAELGMEIVYTDKNKVYYYKITEKLIINKERKDLYKNKDKSLLTLVTNYEDNQMLVIVAELGSTLPYDDADESIKVNLGFTN